MGVPDPAAQSLIMEQRASVDSSADVESVELGCYDWWSIRGPRLAILEFDRGRKSMSSIVRTDEGINKLLVKGAVENVLERSTHLQLSDGSVEDLTEEARNAILAKLHGLSTKALRCLGFAYKEDLGDLSSYDGEFHSSHKLSVLVAVEMFNSLNALSEDGSLVHMPPWANPWLLVAMLFSFSLHFLILYVPILATIFGIVPLNFNEWLFVFVLAFPVILIDEVLKFIGRRMTLSDRKAKKVKVL